MAAAFNRISKPLLMLKQRLNGIDKNELKKIVAEQLRINRRGIVKEQLAIANYFFLQQLLVASQSRVEPNRPEGQRIVVSLTTIPTRLREIAVTIESLLHQTLPPDVVVLWLDQSRCTAVDLPLQLQALIARGVRVEFCEDVGPHTKLVPALRAYPRETIITVDDDVMYPFDLVENLVLASRRGPGRIVCVRAREMKGGSPENFNYVRDWPNAEEAMVGRHVLPLGVGGVLYPAGIFDGTDVLAADAMRDLAPRADDIWFKAMSLTKGVVCEKISGYSAAFPIRPFTQDFELGEYNVTMGGNDVQVRATFGRYQLWSKFSG